MDKRGYNDVLIIIDCFSEIVQTYLYKDLVIVKNIALLFYKGPFRIFGLFGEIISNNGPQFVLDFI